MATEDALEKYPCPATLKDGLECVVRPLRKEDEAAIRELYLAIPEPERLFLKSRMTDGSIFHQWCEHIDYDKNLPLLLLTGDKVIAECTLHQRSGGWKSHIGLLSMLVHPEHRGKGVARILVTELVEIARHCGLQRLEAEFTGEREVAIHAFAMIGFEELVRIPKYVQDMQAQYHDYVLMGMDLLTSEEYAGVG